MVRLKNRMFFVSAQALKLLTKIGARKKKRVFILRIGTPFLYFRYYLICKYPFLNQRNVRIRDKFIYSVYSTFELIEKNRTFLFLVLFFFLPKRKNAISKSKDLNFTLQKEFSFVIRVEEV